MQRSREWWLKGAIAALESLAILSVKFSKSRGWSISSMAVNEHLVALRAELLAAQPEPAPESDEIQWKPPSPGRTIKGKITRRYTSPAITIDVEPTDQEPERYLICFDDPDIKPEHFTDREAAIKRLAALRENRDCDLFGEIAWEEEGK